MNKSAFNPDYQQQNTSAKVVAGLERISEVFKSLLWEKAKVMGLSPIQIQILIFITYHKSNLCNVSHLAKEFNITKATISDAIKVLDKKNLIVKDYSSPDSRSYSILLSSEGEKVVSQINNFTDPLTSIVNRLEEDDLDHLFSSLSDIIYELNKNKILEVQRTCYSCIYHQKNNNEDYCNLLGKKLMSQEIRIDCPEYEEKPVG